MTYDMCVEIDEDPAILHITDTASTVSFNIDVVLHLCLQVWGEYDTNYVPSFLQLAWESKGNRTEKRLLKFFNIDSTSLLSFFFLLWAGKDQKLIFGFADLIEQADLTRDWNQFFYK